MRLIDAEELLKHAYDSGAWKDAETGFHQRVVDIEDIEDAPTVDAEPVVRCKDCKHYGELKLYNLQTGESIPACMENMKSSKDGMGYCSWGERREDADNR